MASPGVGAVLGDYVFRILDGSTVIFNGYFTVQPSSDPEKLITGFYDSDNGFENVLLPTTDYIFGTADNIYLSNSSFFSDPGVNIYSDSLQTFFSSVTNHFHVYSNNQIGGAFTPRTVSFEITEIRPPGIGPVLGDYVFRVLDGSTVIFNGYFTLQPSSDPEKLITGFYDSDNGFENVLLPTTDYIYPNADNIYLRNVSIFSDPGVNIYSNSLQTFFSSQTNHFNLYDKDSIDSFNGQDTDDRPVSFQITEIRLPGVGPVLGDYLIRIFDGFAILFNGYFTVLPSSDPEKLITGFYDSENGFENVLLPTTDYIYPSADNIYLSNRSKFSVPGVNIYSNSLQTFFSSVTNHVHLFSYNQVSGDFSPSPMSFQITEIRPPGVGPVLGDYVFRILDGSNVLFNGYFTVLPSSDPAKLITGFYNSGNGFENVLLPTTDYISDTADNIYLSNRSEFSDPGVNIYSNSLQTFFSSVTNHFNIFENGKIIVLGGEDIPVSFQITEVRPPGGGPVPGDYSLRVLTQATVIFDGYFTVLETTDPHKFITGVYDYALNVDYGYENVLLPQNDWIYDEADNLYYENVGHFSASGVNIYSTLIQTELNTQSNHFTFWFNAIDNTGLINIGNGDFSYVTFQINRIPEPVPGPGPVPGDYLVRILQGETVIYDGYFTVLPSTNPNKFITGFYDYALPLENGFNNVLLTQNDWVYRGADNLYFETNEDFSNEGVNIYSTHIQTVLNTQSNHFNLYTEDGTDYLYEGVDDDFMVTVQITKILAPDPGPPPVPQRSFNMGSLFTNNAQVYYKPHSFSSGGSVTNSRAKKRRT